MAVPLRSLPAPAVPLLAGLVLLAAPRPAAGDGPAGPGPAAGAPVIETTGGTLSTAMVTAASSLIAPSSSCTVSATR